MSLITDLLEKPSNLSTASNYTVMNGVLYLGAGVLIIALAGMVADAFQGRPFVGQEGALFRVVGLLLVDIGWLYFFGGRSGSRQPVAASVIDRLIFVPLIFLPLGERWGVPPFAGGIRDYRSLTGNWRLGSPQSKGLNGLNLKGSSRSSCLLTPPRQDFEPMSDWSSNLSSCSS